MIVARGLGQSTVLGAIAAFGYGIGGSADVTVDQPNEKFWPVSRARVRSRRPPRQDDDEVLLMVQALFTTGIFE